MKSYKFQVLVTVRSAGNGPADVQLGPSPCRVVVRAVNEKTPAQSGFRCPDQQRLRRSVPAPKPRVLATLRVTGDDVGDYLHIGSHFGPWAGADVGEGVVTRRLFV
jgi:hypothetical protein